MSDPTQPQPAAPAQPAQTPTQRAAALIPGPVAAEAPAPEPTPSPVQAAAPKVAAPAPLKDAIEQMRARREAQQKEVQRQTAYEAENARLKAENEALRKASAFEDDPIAYAKAKNWDREAQLTFGKALIYDLAPDQADPNFRVKMFEDKQKREEKTKAEQAEKQRQAEEKASQRETITRFAQDLESGVMQFEAGSYPESEAEYENVEDYLRTMFTTAMRMSEEATQQGTIADLSPASIAKRVEADTVAQVAAREKRRAARRTPSPSGTQQSETPPVVKTPEPQPEASQSFDTTSTKTLSGGGSPQPPAKTEAERKQRALAALFGA